MAETTLPAPVTAGPKNMRTFLIFWAGQFISILGSGLTSFAIGVWIFQKTGQAMPFALTVLFANLPGLLLLPLAGSLADRWNRKALMILADSGNALVTLGLFILLLGGDLQTWHIYLLVTIGSVFSAFQEPAYQSSVSMIVPKKDLTRANGIAQTAQAVQSIITPLIAGGLFVTIGMRGIILIDFVTYFFAVGALLIVRIPQPELPTEEKKQKGQVRQDLLFGWKYLRARQGLFGMLWYFAMVNFTLNFAGVLTGPLVLSAHPASAYGFVQTMLGAGLLTGGLLISSWGGPKTKRVPALIGCIAAASLGVLTVGVNQHLAFPAAGFFVLMLFVPIASSMSQAVFQTKVAPEAQGRVFAVRGLIARSMMPIAYILSGLLADNIFEPLMREGGALANTALGTFVGVGAGRGVGLMFVIAGLIGFTASVLVYLNPRVRNLEEEIPDALPG
jgi:DHA3 family macrolide efflux protein-like MFS transporter